VDFRIHYQDAAADAPLGQPPPGTPRVDVLIPCVASFHEADDQPGAIIRATRPRHILLSHWEDFFRPYTRDLARLRQVRLTNTRKFLDAVATAKSPATSVTLPAPGARFRFGHCR
jgi:hypothetical protein